jgi:catechol 2,3-dioxygenase-like lactoylglutathione lyase family enzyme
MVFLPDPDGNVIEVVTLRPDSPANLSQTVAIGLTVADAQKSRAFFSNSPGARRAAAAGSAEQSGREVHLRVGRVDRQILASRRRNAGKDGRGAG